MGALLAGLVPGLGTKLLGYGALAAAALVVFLLVRHELDARAAAEAAKAVQAEQLDRLQQIDRAKDAAFAEAQRQHQADLDAIAATHRREQAVAAQTLTLEKENADAPSSDDGPLAPVARRGLERLRQLLAPAAPGGGGAADPAPPGPGRAPAAGAAAGAGG